jgi:hypothetical protein
MTQAEANDDPKRMFDQIARDLALSYDNVQTGKIFGVGCIKIQGKAFAAFFQGEIALKLRGDDHRRALEIAGAQLWDPSGKHRSMKEWVQLPYAGAQAWPELAEQALKYVKL